MGALRILAESGGAAGEAISEALHHWISEIWFWAQELHHGYREGTLYNVLQFDRAAVKNFGLDLENFPISLDDIDG